MVRRTIPWILAAALATAAGCTKVPVEKDEAFKYAVEAVQQKRYGPGADAAWTFLATADPDDPRYDRGKRLLARSAEGLDLRWAAGMIYREIAQVRRNMELVPDALQGLERIIDTGVYDEDTLVTSFLSAEEFSSMPPRTQAFIHYYKGLDLERRGNDAWAEVHFDAIPEDSPYHGKAEYVRAVRQVAEGDYTGAIERLEGLREAGFTSEDLKRDVERTLARIAFEEQRYSDALVHFEALREMAPDDPEILLEMAWTHYYLGDSRKCLGLLIALDAPVHATYISPERFLLEALALRRLCQFGAAREAATRLEAKYKASLDALASGTLPQDIPELRTAALRRGFSRDNAVFQERLRAERAIVESSRLDEGLRTYLLDLYDRGIEEARRREEERIDRDITDLTEELLSAREGVRLIVHELGVALLRGRRRPVGAAEKPAVEVPLTGDRVFYPFSGEYWTDELDDLLVIAEDRCID